MAELALLMPLVPPKSEWTLEVFIERYALYYSARPESAVCQQWAKWHYDNWRSDAKYIPAFMIR